MGILYLIIAIAFEVFATSMLKFSHGFDNKLYMTLSILGYMISFYLLSIVLKTMPIGIAYAIWSGFGIIAITIVGFAVFDQRLDYTGLVGITLILIGVIVIHLFSTSTKS